MDEAKEDLPSRRLHQTSMTSESHHIDNRRRQRLANNFSTMAVSWFLILISVCGAREVRIGPGRAAVMQHSESFSSHSHTIHNQISEPNTTTVVAAGEQSETSSGLSWVIERKECGQLDDGCFCERRARNWTSIICRCDNDSQVAHLKPPGPDFKPSALFVQKERWTWRFEHCAEMVLHSRFLSSVDGSHFQVEFHNISKLTVREAAFATRDSYASHGNQNQVSILFSESKIEQLPTKAFPSYLHSITFQGCTIKTLAKRFIHVIKMDKVTIEGSKIHDIESEAFHSSLIIDTLSIENSSVLSIHPNGVASAISKMQWLGSAIDLLQEDAFSGFAAEVTVANSLFANVETGGFSVKTWSRISLINNTFTYVARHGLDLRHPSETSDDGPSADISGNSWEKVERDFIATGSSETAFVRVKDNTFLHQCDCGNTFASYLTMNGSRLWFHEELLNNSQCPVSEQVFTCLQLNGYVNASDSSSLSYDSLNLLCESSVYMCMNEVSEIGVSTEDSSIPGRPHLPNRLRVLAYFIAAMGVFIICSLIITMCVFLCRRKSPKKKKKKKSPQDSPLQDLEHAQGKKTGMTKSLSGGEYADIVFKHQNGAALPRPRSMLLEDVEMEDKGVQTMPTELSSEVLEGLREKLSRPDSFWDAKETIDHLYDLIQVKELNSALSSPPDVTMCNGGTSTTASTARLLPSASSSPVAHIASSAGVSVSVGGSDSHLLQSSNAASTTSSPVSDTPPPLPATSPPSGVPLIQRYAQIRNKVKTAPLCEYSDPSDSSMHIYSELTPHHHHQSQTEDQQTQMSGSSSSSPVKGKKVASPSHPYQNRELPALQKSFLASMRNQAMAHNGPILCEYTEPKDVQSHVYAELANSKPNPNQSKSAMSSPVKKPSPHHHKPHSNTITIAVPPPPINVPHSSSFHDSPRHLSRIKENELSSSNPALASSTPVKIIHVNDDGSSSPAEGIGRPRLLSDKLKRSVSSVDSTNYSPTKSTASVSSLLSDSGARRGSSDTQKRPLPSIPSWSSKNEGKSQF